MAVVNTYYCERCGNEQDAWSSDVPRCCKKKMGWMPTKVNSPEWGGPRQYAHLRDQPFESRSELNRWTRQEGLELSPSAEKHGGARNEDHLNLGKKFSYKGSPKS